MDCEVGDVILIKDRSLIDAKLEVIKVKYIKHNETYSEFYSEGFYNPKFQAWEGYPYFSDEDCIANATDCDLIRILYGIDWSNISLTSIFSYFYIIVLLE